MEECCIIKSCLMVARSKLKRASNSANQFNGVTTIKSRRIIRSKLVTIIEGNIVRLVVS